MTVLLSECFVNSCLIIPIITTSCGMTGQSRLRTVTGCMSCRRRRKKCSEEKPSCDACTRLQLPCVYQVLRDSPVKPVQDYVQPIRLRSNVLRTADWKVAEASVSECPMPINKLFATSSDLISQVSTEDNVSCEVLLAEGFQNDWHIALSSVAERKAIWSDVTKIDDLLHATGHGRVARLVFIWYFLLISQVWDPKFLVNTLTVVGHRRSPTKTTVGFA